MPKYSLYTLFLLSLIILSGTFYAGYHHTHQYGTTLQDTLPQQELVPYEHLFRKEATRINWEWTLLAAVCYEESHFNPQARSRSGALGLMQLMPGTAQQFGLNDSTIFLPADNIKAGTSYIAHLQQTFSFIGNPQEQIHFILASYNAGPAHIMDARRLAKAYGRSPYVWFDNTEYWLKRLNEPTIANDSVVLYGGFDATETTTYIRKVLRTQQRFLKLEE